PKTDIPEFPEYGDQGFASYIVGPYTFKCSAARAIENFVDQAHFPWVHPGLLGSRDHPQTATFDIRRHEEELRFDYEDLPNPIHPVRHRRVYRMYRPFSIHQRKVRDDGGVEIDFYTVTPHSARESTHYCYVMRNYEMEQEVVRKRRD